jgi:hypothetical protein
MVALVLWYDERCRYSGRGDLAATRRWSWWGSPAFPGGLDLIKWFGLDMDMDKRDACPTGGFQLDENLWCNVPS